MTKTARSGLFQRVGGCCEPIQKERLPIPSELKAPKPNRRVDAFRDVLRQCIGLHESPKSGSPCGSNLSGTADFAPSQSDLRRSFFIRSGRFAFGKHRKGMIDLANETQTARSEKTDLKTQLAEVAERIRTRDHGPFRGGNGAADRRDPRGIQTLRDGRE